jgi:hypothetical protein
VKLDVAICDFKFLFLFNQNEFSYHLNFIKENMQIIISQHTLERAEERGASEEEIIDVIRNGSTIDVKYLREGKEKVFSFKQERLGKFYEEKKIRVIFLVENGKIFTVTVYVFYGKWGN